jgi:calcineurin-like phosphoesterase family protein
MAHDIWFISDTHFFHDNILLFRDRQENLIRGRYFSSSAHMNECMVSNWNESIKPQDKVYHLGDVAVGVRQQSEFTELMQSLNGHKRLLLGNHDHIHQPAYREFERIELWTGGKFKQYNFVCSHIPLRPDQMRDGEFNVHGHIHQNLVPDPHYICVCVEHTSYRPVHLDEIRKRIETVSS